MDFGIKDKIAVVTGGDSGIAEPLPARSETGVLALMSGIACRPVPFA